MFEKLKGPFDGGDTDEAGYRWLSADDDENPFTIDGYDCLGYVNSRVTATSDQRIAESFVTLRESTGKEYVGKLPEQAVRIDLELAYGLQGEVTDGIVFKATQMEAKWDVYLYESKIYFCRSWTGQLVYVIEFATAPSADLSGGAPFTFRARRAWIAGNFAAGNPDFIVRQVDYLIKRFLFRRNVPHPLAPDLDRDAAAVAAYSFSVYGNMCCFGTFENTLPHDLLKPKAT